MINNPTFAGAETTDQRAEKDDRPLSSLLADLRGSAGTSH
jgi:hypothetical protein